ncbi:MAG: tRNA (adenosine(37)-N6)-dimethylallyltransferase MiaA [Actinomycetales bacterium]|nr:tRNA (adenosine(37)-N6)-dimethylallyltransferase MiaA [Actinomycetales bacterium]
MTGLVVAVVGPTATGKSDLGLALAEALDGEVVNADAFQLYRGMDIGTAKLSVAERRGVPHHQLDVLDVEEDSTVAAYQAAARADLAEIARRGKRAVVVGGSGLYVRALLDELDFPGTDPAVRARLEERAEHHGTAAVFDELARRDPTAAERIGPRNTRRIVRALEVIEITGEPYSASLPSERYAIPAVQLGLELERPVLDERIGVRVDRMWDAGLVGEVARLAPRLGRTAARAVGYAELLAHLHGESSEDEARAAVTSNTRRLVRRQQSWFRRDTRITWLDAAAPDLLDRALVEVVAADRRLDP